MLKDKGLGVLAFYCLGYSRIRNLILRLKRQPVARFVGFHDILPETLGYFKSNLNFLKTNMNVVSLDDFFLGRLSSEKINVVITFDDGFKSWVTDVVPILKKLKLPATFFLASGCIGLSKNDEAEFIRSKLFKVQGPVRTTGALNFEDVKRIVNEGFIIGGHSLNHCNLGELRDSVQLKYEIAEDKTKLEGITGRKINYFSYPLGVHNNSDINVIDVLRDSGYRGAVTVESGFNSVNSNPYLLHREMVDASIPNTVFRARLYGNYDAVRFVKKIMHSVGFN